MLRSFFQNIPMDLDEAARVDGCTHFQAFRWVIMPVMWPGVITTGLFSFLLAACGTAQPPPEPTASAADVAATVPSTSATLEPTTSGTPAASTEQNGGRTAGQIAEAVAIRIFGCIVA